MRLKIQQVIHHTHHMNTNKKQNSVKQNSPLNAMIEPNDLILTVDNTDVRDKTAVEIGKIFAMRESQRERKIIYLRPNRVYF